MRRLTAILPLFLAAGCYTGQGSEVVAHRNYPVADFRSIALSSDGEVTVLPGDFAVSASAEDNVLPSLLVRVDEGTLVIAREVDWIDGVRPTLPIRFTVTVPELASVAVSGSGRMAVRGVGAPAVSYAVSGAGAIDLVDIPARDWDIKVDGSGTVSAAGIRAATFTTELRGAARAVVYGSADAARITATGSVLYRGAHLRVREATVRVDGAAQADVWVEETLRGYSGGIARLGFRGSPAIEVEMRRDGRLAAVPLPSGADD